MADTTETVDTTQGAETTQEVVETPQGYWATYGYENEEVFKSDFEQMRELKTKAEQLSVWENDYKEKLSILQEAEDPFAGNDEIKTLVSFAKKGINASLATEIVSMSPESVDADPIKALVLAEAIKNPDNYKRLGRAVIEEAIRETYGVGEGEYTPTSRMKLDAANAAVSIENLKKSVEEVKNPYTFAKEVKNQSLEAYTKKQTSAMTELERFSSTLGEIAYEVSPEQKFSLKVSNEEVKAILDSGMAAGLGHFFDVSTKEGREAAHGWLKNQILIHKVQSGDFAKQIIDAVTTDVKKEAVKDVHNGGTVLPDRTGKTSPDGKKLTPAQQDLIARGIPLPSQTTQTT